MFDTIYPMIHGPSLLGDQDIHLFKEGSHTRLHEKLGSHHYVHDAVQGAVFAVWAPNAEKVTVMGDFNGWNPHAHPLAVRWDGSGIFEGFIGNFPGGGRYKYHIFSRNQGFETDKSDPMARMQEMPPGTASVFATPHHDWQDGDWMADRRTHNGLEAPMSIYEVHLGSWMRRPGDPGSFLSYRELAERLCPYARDMNFTHVEFLPVMEHPFHGSWGYQSTGYFAPSARYGSPEDLMYLIDRLHQHGLGVILDWVPSHFPMDNHGLVYFDGTHLYEHADPKQGFQPDWQSAVFNYGRNEVRSFLTSSAVFWLDTFHADGLRVDAVASMLYLDYSRREGEWVPNVFGGRENLAAIGFLRHMNEAVYRDFPDVQTIAEESTAWPMVSNPTYLGGLGFGMKWNMGWMHDTLKYFSLDPFYRKFHQNQLTFGLVYAFHENFVLPLSHDEVVHGKGSLLGKMPGDPWQKLANLRLLFGFMWGHPGKKLLFMGQEFGQEREWNHDAGLDWGLLDDAGHKGVKRWLEDLNRFYRQDAPLFERDFKVAGFNWIDFHDAENSTLSFVRQDASGNDLTLVACNFTPVPRQNYRLGVPRPGVWREVLNSDAKLYGGAGWGNMGRLASRPVPSHGRFDSVTLNLPPLGALFLKPET
jgi:1,4-alpha-glucan branching enzyme